MEAVPAVNGDACGAAVFDDPKAPVELAAEGLGLREGSVSFFADIDGERISMASKI